MEGSYRGALLNRGFESHSLRQRVRGSAFTVRSSQLAVQGLAISPSILLGEMGRPVRNSVGVRDGGGSLFRVRFFFVFCALCAFSRLSNSPISETSVSLW
jgi:hypothetical protein